MVIKPIFVFLLVFLLCFAGCGPVPEYNFSQNFKDYVHYSSGSYWIYRDSMNPLTKDSVIIQTNTYNVKAGGGGKPSKTQTLSTRYYSSRDSIYLIDGEYNRYGDKDTPGYGDDGYIDTTASINYFFDDQNNPYDVVKPYSVSGPASLKVKNTVYNDVLKFTAPNYNKTVFWSKHIGVIKSIYRGITWELDTFIVKQ